MAVHKLLGEVIGLSDRDCTEPPMVACRGAQVAGGLIGAAAAINYIPKPWLGCVLHIHTEYNGFVLHTWMMMPAQAP